MFKAVVLSPALGSHLISSVEISIVVSAIMYLATLMFLALNWAWNSYLRKIAEAKGDIKKREILDTANRPQQRIDDKEVARRRETPEEMED